MEEYIQVGPYIYVKKASELIGRGAFGAVYKCKKIDNPDVQLCAKFINLKQDIELRIRQQRELHVMQELLVPQNQNLVQLHYIVINETNNELQLVMELCEGTLGRLLRSQTFTPEQALYVIQQVVNGYKSLIEKGIIHRDIKPDNILYTGNIFKISDFGLSRLLDDAPEIMSSCGTPGYASPQVLLKEKYTNKADIFSLGMTFYQMIYGKLPYGGTHTQLIKGTLKLQQIPIRLWEYKLGLTQSIRELVQSMLKFREEDRISWQELFNHPLMRQQLQFNFTQQVQTIQQNISNEDLSSSLFDSIMSSSSFNGDAITLNSSNSGSIQLEQFDPITQINQLNYENLSISDEYYIAGILHSSAFVLLQQNGHLKNENIADYYGVLLLLARLSIRLLEASKLSYQVGTFSFQQIESLLIWQVNELQVTVNEIKTTSPQLLKQLIELTQQFNQTKWMEFYRKRINLFPYQSQQQYHAKYLQLLYFLDKISELTSNDFHDLSNSINQIKQQITDQVEIRNYLQKIRLD